MITLYDDQQRHVNKVIEAMHAGHRSILMQAATGAGKSVMASYMLHRALNKGNNVWFLVPRKNLIKQMHSTFNQFGVRHSYIAAGNSLNPYEKAHICSTETVRRRLKTGKIQARPRCNEELLELLKSGIIALPQIAFIDETHYGGNGLGEIIAFLKANGVWIIGLSATPWQLNGQGLGCWYDHMVLGESVRWLIDNKRLSDYRPFAPSRVDLSRVRMANGEYSQRDISQRMEDDSVLIGNAVQHYKDHAHGRLNIAYCTSIKHSELVADEFRRQGVPAMHIDGETPDGERRRIIQAYANREILVLTNCELLTFGFDLASQVGRDVTIECMSDLRPTKSLALQMQKWGRVLRMKDTPALIFDHANNFDEHGLPCDDRQWTLADRVKGAGGGGGVRMNPVKLCPECYYSHKPNLECPNCGYVYPVESRELFEVDGELAEIERQNKERKLKRMEVGQAKTLADLRRIREERGYKPDWVVTMARAKGIKE